MRSHEPFEAFGWVLHRTQMEPGDVLFVSIPKQVARQDAANLNLYTHGTLQVQRTDLSKPATLRNAGDYSPEHGPLIAGEYRVTAQTESELWCVNHTLNGRSLPNLQVLRLRSGGTLDLPPNQRGLLCRGSGVLGDVKVAGPIAFVTSGTRTLFAHTDCYGLLFEGVR